MLVPKRLNIQKAHDYAENPEIYDFGSFLLLQAKNLRKSERTQADIFNAGCSLLNRHALASLKVSTICREAGIAHGTFYIYFPNRQAFVATLLLRFVDYLQTIMHQASKTVNDDTVRTTMRAYYQLFVQNTGMMKCLINHLEEFPSSLAAFQKLNREWATTVVAAAKNNLLYSGTDRVISREELFRRAYALGGMVDQYLSALLLHHDPTLESVSRDREAVIETLSLIWERGMAA